MAAAKRVTSYPARTFNWAGGPYALNFLTLASSRMAAR